MQNNVCRAFLITKKINLTEDLSVKESYRSICTKYLSYSF